MPCHKQQIALLNRHLWESIERFNPSFDQVAIKIDEM